MHEKRSHCKNHQFKFVLLLNIAWMSDVRVENLDIVSFSLLLNVTFLHPLVASAMKMLFHFEY